MVSDRVFHAVQEIAYNEELISDSETAIKKIESELALLRNLSLDKGDLAGVKQREAYLAGKLKTATSKIKQLERENSNLKEIFVRNNDDDNVKKKRKIKWFF